MRIGTRASELAVAQAQSVAELLAAQEVEVEVVRLSSSGDRGEHVADKSRWTAELERALLDGDIELAVHSAKDVPTQLADGTELAAFPAREHPGDALCGAASLAALTAGARVGTGSLRRAAQLRAIRDDLSVVALRGNVDTRLRRLEQGALDAIVLALAGLRRLGRADAACAVLEQLVPAAGQGALAIQACSGTPAAAAAAALSDPPTAACVAAERELMRRLGASCHTPVGAHARIVEEGIELVAWVGLPDGSEWISDHVIGAAAAVPETLSERLLSVGAAELLRRAESEAA
jgi:hydroxymethylbilane synthase